MLPKVAHECGGSRLHTAETFYSSMDGARDDIVGVSCDRCGVEYTGEMKFLHKFSIVSSHSLTPTHTFFVRADAVVLIQNGLCVGGQRIEHPVQPTYTHKHTYTSTHTHIHQHTHIHVQTNVNTYKHTHIETHRTWLLVCTWCSCAARAES